MGVTFDYDYWGNQDGGKNNANDETTEVTFFMPNGVLIIQTYSVNATLQELKAVSCSL